MNHVELYDQFQSRLVPKIEGKKRNKFYQQK